MIVDTKIIMYVSQKQVWEAIMLAACETKEPFSKNRTVLTRKGDKTAL